MIRHLLIVAIGFRLAGILLGAASIAALVDLADTALLLRRTPPPEIGPPLDIKTYGLVGLLGNAARGVGFGLHALAGLLSILLVMAVAAVLALLLASPALSDRARHRPARHLGADRRDPLEPLPCARLRRHHGGDAARSCGLRHAADRAFALHALGADLALRLKPRTRVVG
jgi:hypothetical protein